ncbi:LytR/AlgR family response regulator transcription factor [Pedobacter xixiisoli]|uniref:Two component transcriptional regulator, LytTR family n=1 Tax=Pedobacter xixiisoli TaxID=1476464 RepID=A0A286A0M4_9SPHI|nr:LytTR family DNA-binding domain-containing protein [Pedobacter xixiisoli]SOD15435.1 two component transcriptional regulator, LytTR family [Pedobacter xixiisoli]
MTKIVIIEDEAPAVRKLKRFLEELSEPLTIVAELSSVEDAIVFFKDNVDIDIVFSDIELTDGNAFGIYQKVTPNCPIIFTTAYNQFLMDAFESNGIAYLLKPFSFGRFEKAWQKFKLLYQSKPQLDNSMIEKLGSLLGQSSIQKNYRTRFSISKAKSTYFLEIDDIVFLNAEDGIVFAIDCQGKKHLLTQATLKEIEEDLDPKCFFRINRGQLVHKTYIIGLERYNKNTLAVKLKNSEQNLMTSQSATSVFKDWIEK